jgi:hypothetical protein
MPSNPAAQARWTPERQLAFLDTLACTRSVSRAAASAGMSRESAYRLRRRPAGALFAAAWNRVMWVTPNWTGFVTLRRGAAVSATAQRCQNCQCRDPRRCPVHAFLSLALLLGPMRLFYA